MVWRRLALLCFVITLTTATPIIIKKTTYYYLYYLINWYSCCLLFGIDITILVFTFIVLRVDTLRERERGVVPSALLNCASVSPHNTLVVVVVMIVMLLLDQCCVVQY